MLQTQSLRDEVRVGRYDSSGHLVEEVEHRDGRFVEPVTIEEGDTLWFAIPGQGLQPLPPPRSA